MASFEESLNKTRVLTTRNEPPETDLNYYAKPENYTGSSLAAMQRLIHAQQKQEEMRRRQAKKNGPFRKKNHFQKTAILLNFLAETSGKKNEKNNYPRNKPGNRSRSNSKDSKSVMEASHPEDIIINEPNSERLPVIDNEPNTLIKNNPTSSNDGIITNSFRRNRRSSLAESFASSTKGPKLKREPSISLADDAITLYSERSDTQDSVSVTERRRSLRHSATGRRRQSSKTQSGPVTIAVSIEVKKRVARARFKWAIRMVTILLKWVSVMLQKKQSDEEEDNTYTKESGDKKMTTFTDLASDAYTVQPDDLNNSSLAFDPAYFKAKREVNISNEVKYILSLPPFARTQDQLQTALYGLQHLRSFAEYPLHMQEKLCKVAWFSQVPPKRVIIRQGHTAENFYFILSGQAVVSILEVNPKTKEPNMRTATVMRKGMSFGELALLHHSKRTATVVSQDFVQLLAVGRDDFFDIFMSGQGPGEIPEHVKFLKGVEFMKGWPIETLEEHPEQCLFHFFKRGVVVVRDSLNSEWIYVVKSGTCQVMKELKQVTGTVGLKKKITLAGLDNNLPQLGTCEQVPKIDNGRPHQRRNTCPIVPASALRSAITGFEDYMLEMQIANVPNSLPAINDEQSLVGSVEHKQPDHDGGKEKKVKFEDDKPIIKLQKESLQATDDKKVRSPTKSPIRLRAGSFNSVTSSSDATSRSSSPGESRSRAPIFVQVELLTSRDVFGLSNLFDIEDGLDIPKTSVSLISRGAECVMINKDFFMKHASDEIKRHLRGLINIYPEEETLQENLQIKADWDVYKKQLIRTMTENSPSSR
ncbi:unnamed protein product [Owenia fusiformis]|uniref:Cyclic nucleotide-binding domain-containing protein n=1 Tax=Owenia fusiformis TaxID=6347 RepID=A0A8S4N8U1_OWEFU|nr:unnamed protein product [Owenia fusiformis]